MKFLDIMADTEKGATGYYLYDGLEVLEEISSRLNQKMAVYYRANGRILTRQEFEVSQGDNPGYQNRPTGRRLYYSYDGLGPTIALTDHNGKLVTGYRYDAYGRLTEGDIDLPSYTLTGKRYDRESGLYHFHFRRYDPLTGAWTTPDEIGVLGDIKWDQSRNKIQQVFAICLQIHTFDPQVFSV